LSFFAPAFPLLIPHIAHHLALLQQLLATTIEFGFPSLVKFMQKTIINIGTSPGLIFDTALCDLTGIKAGDQSRGSSKYYCA
jgi:hypothetical protein